MNQRFFSIYRIPLLASLVLAVVIMALLPARLPVHAGIIILGCIIGTFVLDLEYVIYATLLEPKKDFSKTLHGYIKHKDLNNAANHIFYHKDELEDGSLNNALFQIVMGLLSIFVVTATNNLFAKALILSIFANSIYKLLEFYYQGRGDKWFWTFKSHPDKSGTFMFAGVMGIILALCLYFI